jgi:nitrite reductase (NADH) small subunit
MMNLGRLDNIPQGEGRIFHLGHTSIAVFHTRSGGVFATEPSCPHKAGPLADGIIGEQQVVCPLHAFVFDLSNGEPVGNNCTALKTYRATVTEEGEIVVVF